MNFNLKSSAFENHSDIPKQFTCDGENISPELEWSGAPQGTESLVLIVDDPDAPVGTWSHLVVYNIPSNITKLEENIQDLPGSAQHGENSWGEQKYGGPCPPFGKHRYYFKLYALDITLDSEHKFTRANIEKLIQDHILGEAVILGLYDRHLTK